MQFTFYTLAPVKPVKLLLAEKMLIPKANLASRLPLSL